MTSEADQSARASRQDGSDHTLKETVSDAADAAAAAAREAGGKAADTASELFEPIKQDALDRAEEQKRAGADRLSGMAQAVHQAADQLDPELPPQARTYIHEAADGIDRMSAAIRDRSVGDLMETAGDFARRQPAAFFGGAVLAGFVLSRFLKSSSGSDASDHRTPRAPDNGQRHTGDTFYAANATGGPMYGVPSSGTTANGASGASK
jgi:hypothetical protein